MGRTEWALASLLLLLLPGCARETHFATECFERFEIGEPPPFGWGPGSHSEGHLQVLVWRLPAGRSPQSDPYQISFDPRLSAMQQHQVENFVRGILKRSKVRAACISEGPLRFELTTVQSAQSPGIESLSVSGKTIEIRMRVSSRDPGPDLMFLPSRP